ncbi:putative oxalocrotonate tautomerase [Xylogone sp. PMI_703]|nr:putative oxalocrotonate tautomerase [Xylogone sp. PMI_703]
MPLWIIYHSAGTFEDDTAKQALSESITGMYTSIGLPAFYVVVNFVKLPVNDIWVGGKMKTDKPFVRMCISHIAHRLPDSDRVYERVVTLIDELLKPHIADKGYDWEFHVEETDRRLWKVNGLVPPPRNSEAEKMWFKENRAIPWSSKL